MLVQGSTSARTSGRMCPSRRLRLLHPVRSDSRIGSVSHARIRTAYFRSVVHAARMTCPRLFHTIAVPVSSRLPGRLAPASCTTAPRRPCLLPHRRRWPAPPPRVGDRGLALPALMDTNADGLHLQHETLECNIRLKQIKPLGHTFATCV